MTDDATVVSQFRPAPGILAPITLPADLPAASVAAAKAAYRAAGYSEDLINAAPWPQARGDNGQLGNQAAPPPLKLNYGGLPGITEADPANLAALNADVTTAFGALGLSKRSHNPASRVSFARKTRYRTAPRSRT